jgi:hypothetical protein
MESAQFALFAGGYWSCAIQVAEDSITRIESAAAAIQRSIASADRIDARCKLVGREA